MASYTDLIGEYNTVEIIEAIEQTIMNEDNIRDNIMINIDCWDDEDKKIILDYLKRKFER